MKETKEYDEGMLTFEDRYYRCLALRTSVYRSMCRDNKHSQACQDYNGREDEYDKYGTKEYLEMSEASSPLIF